MLCNLRDITHSLLLLVEILLSLHFHFESLGRVGHVTVSLRIHLLMLAQLSLQLVDATTRLLQMEQLIWANTL